MILKVSLFTLYYQGVRFKMYMNQVHLEKCNARPVKNIQDLELAV